MAGKSPMQKIQESGQTPMSAQPDKGKGTALTIEALEERYGKRNAKEVYYRAALAAGYGNFRNSAYRNLPPLDTTGLKGSAKEALEAALADADKEFGATEADTA